MLDLTSYKLLVVACSCLGSLICQDRISDVLFKLDAAKNPGHIVAFELLSEGAAYRKGLFVETGESWRYAFRTSQGNLTLVHYDAPLDTSLSLEADERGSRWSGTMQPGQDWQRTYAPPAFGRTVWGTRASEAWAKATDRGSERLEGGRVSARMTTELHGHPAQVEFAVRDGALPFLEFYRITRGDLLMEFTALETSPTEGVIRASLKVGTGASSNETVFRRLADASDLGDTALTPALLFANQRTSFEGQFIKYPSGARVDLGASRRSDVTAEHLHENLAALKSRWAETNDRLQLGPDEVFASHCGATAAFLLLRSMGGVAALEGVFQGLPHGPDGLVSVRDMANFLSEQGLHVVPRSITWQDLGSLERPTLLLVPTEGGHMHYTLVAPDGDSSVIVFDPPSPIGRESMTRDLPEELRNEWRSVGFFPVARTGGSRATPLMIWSLIGGSVLLLLVAFRRRPEAAAALLSVVIVGCQPENQVTQVRAVVTRSSSVDEVYGVRVRTHQPIEVASIQASCGCVKVERKECSIANDGSEFEIAELTLRRREGTQTCWVTLRNIDSGEMSRHELPIGLPALQAKVSGPSLAAPRDVLRLRAGEIATTPVFVQIPAHLASRTPQLRTQVMSGEGTVRVSSSPLLPPNRVQPWRVLITLEVSIAAKAGAMSTVTTQLVEPSSDVDVTIVHFIEVID